MQTSCLKKLIRAHISILGEFKNYHHLSPYLSSELPERNKPNYFSRQVRPWEILGYICRGLGFLILSPRPRKTYLLSLVWTLHHRGRDGPVRLMAWESRGEYMPSLQRVEKKRQGWSSLVLLQNQPIRLSQVSPGEMEVRRLRGPGRLSKGNSLQVEGTIIVGKEMLSALS